eukprot:SAG31_NODE_2602_length_5401_cov_26.913052_5_plen_581_part_00
MSSTHSSSNRRHEALLQIAEQIAMLQDSGQVQFFSTIDGFILHAGRRLGISASPDLREAGLADFSIKEIYEFGNLLGTGVSASVHEVTLRTAGKKAALKVISKLSAWWIQGTLKRRMETTIREVSLLQKMTEQKISGVTQIFAVIETKEAVMILMELCSGGDVMQILRKAAKLSEGAWPEARAAYVLRAVAHTLNALHKINIIHRDVKPENILLCGDHALTNVRLTDFGLSNSMKPNQSLISLVGTRHYMAPEMLSKNPTYVASVDLWGLGIVMYTMLSTNVPFAIDESHASTEEYLETIEQGPDFLHQNWADKSVEARQVISHLLSRDPDQRMTVDQFLQSEWVSKYAPMWERDGEHLLQQVADKRIQRTSSVRTAAKSGLLRNLLCCLPVRDRLSPSCRDSATAAQVAPMRDTIVNAAHDSGQNRWPKLESQASSAHPIEDIRLRDFSDTGSVYRTSSFDEHSETTHGEHLTASKLQELRSGNSMMRTMDSDERVAMMFSRTPAITNANSGDGSQNSDKQNDGQSGESGESDDDSGQDSYEESDEGSGSSAADQGWIAALRKHNQIPVKRVISDDYAE